MNAVAASKQQARFVVAILLTFGMFALWGFAHRLYNTLLPNFSSALSLTPDQTSLAQWSLSIGYYLMALPAAIISRNFGFKSGMVFGLGCFAMGLFFIYPAEQTHTFSLFLGAAVIMGSGLVILEVSADPLVMRLGPKESAVRRLNIAQALNPLGLILGIFVGNWILHTHLQNPISAGGQNPAMPLIVLGTAVLLIAFVMDYVRFPPVAIDRVAKSESTLKSFAPLFRLRLFKWGLSAQFLYAVAQFVVWGFTARFVLAESSGTGPDTQTVELWSLYAFTAGRLLGTGLMYRYDSSVLLALFAGGAAVVTATAALAGGHIGVLCLVAASFFLSIQFPTIFASAARDLGEHTKSGAAVLMFVNSGGAAVLAILNVVVTKDLVQPLMALPALCFAGIAIFAIAFRRATAQA